MDSDIQAVRPPIKILLVDDDPIILDLMKEYVTSFGFDFATASNGVEAANALENDFYSIVITDISMPEMDGIELLKHVRLNHPKTGVIVVTGLSEEYSYVDVINAGAIDYLTKPFEGGELLAKLNRVIREQNSLIELEKQSLSDALTNLYNRRHFNTKIVEELHRSTRQSYEVVLTFIDVDNFKGYNDTYGHQAGDNLLSTFGHLLLKCVRCGVDFAFRYGGDEFAIIITHTTIDQVVKILERMMETYMSYSFGETSLSCGICEFKRQEDKTWNEDINDFIKKTDIALYQAKASGKGQIIHLTR